MSSLISYLHVSRRPRRDGTLHYRYTLRDLPGEPSYIQDRAQQSRANLESNLQNAAERLRQISGGGPPVTGEFTFADLGDFLGRDYLPPQVVEYLFSSSIPLVIETEDPELPWEIVRYGGVTLGAHRPISRRVPTRQRPPDGAERWGDRRHALLIGDTLGDSPDAAREVRELHASLKAYHKPYAPTPLTGPLTGLATTRHAIRQAISGGVEFLHVAGHLVVGKRASADSAIICAGGDLLTVQDIRGFNADYAYVFLNGCRGGRAALASRGGMDEVSDYLISSGGVTVEGLAIPFLEGGASVFISSLWRVRDAAAYRFAHAFYQQALTGMALGEALRRVRETWLRDHADDPAWGAYVMYGDPLLTFDTVRDPERLAEPATRAVSHYPLVSIPRRDMAANIAFRDNRVERFFRRFEPEPEITLSKRGAQVLQETLNWVDQRNWNFLARFDLLVGMARVKGGMVERGLIALGSSTEQLGELNIEAFGQGKRRADQPHVSPGVLVALMRAVALCARRGSAEVSEDDLVAGLLNTPATGSLRVIFKALDIEESAALLEAARGKRPPAPMPRPAGARISSVGLLLTPRGRTKIDVTPRRMLRDLRAEIEQARRHENLRPFVGREAELFELLRTLASADDTPHVVVHGPPGVGSHTLAYYLATRIVTHPDASDTASIADWGLEALRLTRESERVSEWLPDEIQQLRRPTIILLEDLPALLKFDGVAETLSAMLRHPHLRLLATAHTDDYRSVRRAFPAISDALTSTTLEPPSHEEALRMVAAHKTRLERHYQLSIQPDALRVAIGLAPAEAPLVLPGAALARLERACARLVNRAIDAQAGSAAPEADRTTTPTPSDQPNSATMTRPAAAPVTLTASDLRDATP